MHLAIDAVGVRHSGGAVVLRDLLEVAAGDARLSRITVFSAPPDERQFDYPQVAHVVDQPCPRAARSRRARIIWGTTRVGFEAQRIGADVLLCTSGIGFGTRRTRSALLIQQSLPFCWEALSRTPRRNWLRMGVIRALMHISSRRSQRVIVQTPTMARWIARAFGMREDQLVVCTPSPRVLTRPAATPSVLAPMLDVSERGRLLYVGNTSGYKNVDVAICAMPEIRRSCPGATLFLTWPADHPAAHIDGVVCLGYLDEPALAEAYALATVLVQPSLVESGTLTPLEAMSLGTPVIAADRPYARDICGDVALYFDPHDAGALARQAALVLGGESEATAELRAAGRALVAQSRASEPYRGMVDALVGLGR